MILTKQLSRVDAINELKNKPYSNEEKLDDFNYISKKLGISEQVLVDLFNSKNKSFKDYKSNYFLIQFFVKVARFLKLERRLIHW